MIETAGCGTADGGLGSGIALAEDLVLTAAHVVASAGGVEVGAPGSSPAGGAEAADIPARVVAYDPLRDLALLRPADPFDPVPPPPDGVSLGVDDRATVVAGATSGDVAAVVQQVTLIEMDEVRGQRRSTRRGYRIEAETTGGDSGAGLYDDRGRLAGLVFAVSTADSGRTWVTAESEIAEFLDEYRRAGRPDDRFICHPARSRIEPIS